MQMNSKLSIERWYNTLVRLHIQTELRRRYARPKDQNHLAVRHVPKVLTIVSFYKWYWHFFYVSHPGILLVIS
jgi:hypothetical protein